MRYVKPTWYFNLNPIKGNVPYWVDYRKLDTEQKTLINVDEMYEEEISMLKDAAYQAWNSGIIELDTSKKMDDAFLQSVENVKDNYRFIRKYFSPVWAVYVLVLRLLLLHNPLREIASFIATGNVKRFHFHGNGTLYDSYAAFESPLLKKMPKVSVIIPTLNRYVYLKDAIEDLEKQTYRNFELIVIDQSEPFRADFYDAFDLDLRVMHQEEKALWLARNRAIKISKGEYILLFDDDSRVEADWIEQHLKALDYFDADISAGVSISTVGEKVPDNYAYFRWSDQLDTGNALLKKFIFERIGLFDRQFEKQRMGDGEYGLRAYLSGYKNISHPYAKRLHLKVSSGGLRHMGSWDAFRTKKIFAPRPIPSVLYLYRKYFGKKAALFSLLISVPPSVIPYKYKSRRSLKFVGALLALFMLPILLIQVRISWKKSGAMLEEGDKIGTL